ncbi:histidine kinase [Nocardioides silvaticus]|uniref:histidine kinase n=1 Tax=Nocardioides silvaticus TaxID=2201891 RepID=A0A316TK13_9ACTN|nr:sensor domain-containing protein [Nocardioides silvaticus]PWN02602.1 histidine kinase [Nocardioides silvaticus]
MSRAPDAWSAVRGHPWRLLTSAWPWRSLAYLATSAPIGLATLVVLATTLLLGAATVVVVVGVAVLAGIPLLTGLLGVLERRRLALVRPRPATGTSLGERLRAGRRVPVSWAEVGYAVLLSGLLWPVDALVLIVLLSLPAVLLLAPWLRTTDEMNVFGWHLDTALDGVLGFAAGVLALVLAAYLITLLAAAQGALARLLLDPQEARLAAAVAELRRSRIDLVDAFETERRRIERDLHDGAQQRLVALTMTLGRAELEVPEGEGQTLVRAARRQAELALEELRGTVRGIHPRVLVDHGLAAAVHELADRSSVPVTVDITLPDRLPAPVEAAAYFVVSEALTNVSRHSRARRAEVHAWQRDGRLVVTVVDDGVGGADETAGSGLVGLRIRLDALGGRLQVHSPDGGPTEVRMECPCLVG